MELEEETWKMPPLWAQNGELNHRDRRHLRRSYSLLVTSTSLLVLFLVIALVFTFIVVPTLHSFASSIFRPHIVKKSWDSLNLVLVLFAIVCGFLSKNNETQTQNQNLGRSFSNPSTPPPWYQYRYSDAERSLNRLRSFNSYPDLRQHVPADEHFRFYDDTRLYLRERKPRLDFEEDHDIIIENVAAAPSQSPPSTPPQHRSEAVRGNVEPMYQAEPVEKREVIAENSELPQSQSPPPPPSHSIPKAVRRNVKRCQAEIIEKHEEIAQNSEHPPSRPRWMPSPPPQPRSEAVRRNVKRTYQAEPMEKHETNYLVAENSEPPSQSPPVARTKAVRRNAKRTYQKKPIERQERNDSDVKISQPPSPPQPPPPPLAEGKTVHGKKKRGTATKEFLTSLRGKKKKQRQRSTENFDHILNSEPFPLASQPPTLPPSLPPSHSVFQNLFSSKKSKLKKRQFMSVATTRIQNKRDQSSSYSLEEDNVMIIGNESPSIPIPPPPPPFKLPAWRFQVQGDFVRVDSIGSSGRGSPDLDETSTQDGTSQCSSPFAPHGEDHAIVTAPSLFCPSPDVDTKAHNFIQSFRAGLRMARMNSMKEKQGGIGRSSLGPSPDSQTVIGTRPS
ncbi:hypothetical protein RJT34_17281 [Clitoria ternatea]|uniref:Uncharacterized protein n=1 Tax=Clitoria ternatea TaxID=43366 RepID=A0AAN9PEP1_CLITE